MVKNTFCGNIIPFNYLNCYLAYAILISKSFFSKQDRGDQAGLKNGLFIWNAMHERTYT